MADPRAVRAIAARLGYPETAAWIEEHPHEYTEGVFRGFVSSLKEEATK
jgi:hypothetical protein